MAHPFRRAADAVSGRSHGVMALTGLAAIAPWALGAPAFATAVASTGAVGALGSAGGEVAKTAVTPSTPPGTGSGWHSRHGCSRPGAAKSCYIGMGSKGAATNRLQNPLLDSEASIASVNSARQVAFATRRDKSCCRLVLGQLQDYIRASEQHRRRSVLISEQSQ